MKLTYIKSACVIVECQGKKVMCDPWLLDGIYYGSWYHYPPIKWTPEELSGVDYVYITHIHPDHLDVATLKRMPKDIPILIHNFADKFVLNLLRRTGMENIREISHREVVELGQGFTIESLAADNCDPSICGRYFHCQLSAPYSKTKQIDTLAVFRGDGQVIVNTNDCPYEISKTVCNDILKRHGQVDLLLVGYRGAGPYPQCFDNLDEAGKRAQAIVHRDKMMKQSFDFIRHLKPKAFMPFAGQYVLGGKLAGLNTLILPNLEDLPDLYGPLGEQMILLNSGEWVDVGSFACSAPYTFPDPVERQRYIDEVLAQKLLDYEGDEWAGEDLTGKLQQAVARMHHHQKQFGDYKTDWNVYLDTGQGELYRIPFEQERVVEKVTTEVEPFLRISVDYRLMVRILERKAHWNNAEIGSHLRFYRRPNEFDRMIHYLLSYLQC